MSSPSKWSLTQEGFDALLNWLDPDREAAGYRYEDIRYRLITMFRHRGCWEAEELADETINIAAAKVKDLSLHYIGDPALYFYGVAQNVFKDHLRRRRPLEMPIVSQSEDVEQQHWCLEFCLQQLPSDNRKLIRRYYEGERQTKIAARKRLAQELGLAAGALRIRAHRLRAGLEQCMTGCLQGAGEGRIPLTLLQ